MSKNLYDQMKLVHDKIKSNIKEAEGLVEVAKDLGENPDTEAQAIQIMVIVNGMVDHTNELLEQYAKLLKMVY